MPPSGNSLRIELMTLNVPFVTWKNLDVARSLITIKIGNVSPQEVFRFVHSCGRGDCPNAKFVAA